jgi:hypothetical protein
MNPVRLDPQGPFKRARFLHPSINNRDRTCVTIVIYLDPNYFGDGEVWPAIAQTFEERAELLTIQIKCVAKV